MIRDLSGVGALNEALTTTNTHLAAVLAELQETNGQRLERVADELVRMNATLERLLAQGSGTAVAGEDVAVSPA